MLIGPDGSKWNQAEGRVGAKVLGCEEDGQIWNRWKKKVKGESVEKDYLSGVCM